MRGDVNVSFDPSALEWAGTGVRMPLSLNDQMIATGLKLAGGHTFSTWRNVTEHE